MLGWALAITTAVALVALLLRWAARPPDTAAIATWAASYNLRLDPEEHTYVSGQLRRGRWLRTLGGVIPLAVGQGVLAWWGLVYARPLPARPAVDARLPQRLGRRLPAGRRRRRTDPAAPTPPAGPRGHACPAAAVRLPAGLDAVGRAGGRAGGARAGPPGLGHTLEPPAVPFPPSSPRSRSPRWWRSGCGPWCAARSRSAAPASWPSTTRCGPPRCTGPPGQVWRRCCFCSATSSAP